MGRGMDAFSFNDIFSYFLDFSYLFSFLQYFDSLFLVKNYTFSYIQEFICLLRRVNRNVCVYYWHVWSWPLYKGQNLDLFDQSGVLP